MKVKEADSVMEGEEGEEGVRAPFGGPVAGIGGSAWVSWVAKLREVAFGVGHQCGVSEEDLYFGSGMGIIITAFQCTNSCGSLGI